MKINNPADKPVVAPSTVGATRSANGNAVKAETAAKQEATAEASTQVALSNAASSLLANDAVSGDFDTEKVARIAQAIAEGKFEINPHAIADKLLANAQELLVKTPH